MTAGTPRGLTWGDARHTTTFVVNRTSPHDRQTPPCPRCRLRSACRLYHSACARYGGRCAGGKYGGTRRGGEAGGAAVGAYRAGNHGAEVHGDGRLLCRAQRLGADRHFRQGPARVHRGAGAGRRLADAAGRRAKGHVGRWRGLAEARHRRQSLQPGRAGGAWLCGGNFGRDGRRGRTEDDVAGRVRGQAVDPREHLVDVVGEVGGLVARLDHDALVEIGLAGQQVA